MQNSSPLQLFRVLPGKARCAVANVGLSLIGDLVLYRLHQSLHGQVRQTVCAWNANLNSISSFKYQQIFIKICTYQHV